MSGFRQYENTIYGPSPVGDAQGGDELLSPGIWFEPGAGIHYAHQTTSTRTVADEGRGSILDPLGSLDATLAAVRCIGAVYGNEIGFDPVPLLGGLVEFWLDRFGEGYSTPKWREPAPHQKAPTAREDTAPAPSPSSPLETDGR